MDWRADRELYHACNRAGIAGSFKLGDLGHGKFALHRQYTVLTGFLLANWIDNHFTERITPPALRPPEVVLGLEWNQAVDIWSLACVVS